MTHPYFTRSRFAVKLTLTTTLRQITASIYKEIRGSREMGSLEEAAGGRGSRRCRYVSRVQTPDPKEPPAIILMIHTLITPFYVFLVCRVCILESAEE